MKDCYEEFKFKGLFLFHFVLKLSKTSKCNLYAIHIYEESQVETITKSHGTLTHWWIKR